MGKLKYLIVPLFTILEVLSQSEDLLSDTDAEWSLLGYSGYAGEVVINPLTGSSYFYWLFQANQGNIFTDKRPLIIWLSGGPGCSGDTYLIFDNATPFIINSNGKPVSNPYAWTSEYHLMTIDYPLGVGFSFANSPYDYKNNTTGDSNQLYNFLIRLTQKYPAWLNRDIYFFGESYGGHWVPGIAYKILSENQSPNPQFKFNLKGIGMGDPWIDPSTQTSSYGHYAYSSGLINQEELQIIETYEQELQTELSLGNLPEAYMNWGNILGLTAEYSGGINIYDIRQYTNYNYTIIEEWLNSNETKTMLHAPLNIVHEDCSQAVYNMTQDFLSSTGILLPFILDSINVLIWIGQDDFIVNTPAIENTIANINWPNIQNLINTNKIIWRVNGQIAGYVKKFSTFTFASLMKSGHMGSHDQPVNARDMLFRFINNEGWQQ
ncbi:unnamed protein product [Blepharisma stoltei]|uniref:Carboxypeptidase n=1 Tax=Blepharisma stoltei TaxID=1481888 RepID=A0AAU9K635_9CILI|nr:unnamed protein product [Blepharisma stoltei]